VTGEGLTPFEPGGGSANVLDAALSGDLPHGLELRVGAKPRDRLRKIPVESVTALLLNLTALGRRFVAVPAIESRFLVTSEGASPSSILPSIASTRPNR